MLGLSSFWTLVYNPSLSKYKLKHDWKLKPIILLEKIVSSCFPPQQRCFKPHPVTCKSTHFSKKKTKHILARGKLQTTDFEWILVKTAVTCRSEFFFTAKQ